MPFYENVFIARQDVTAAQVEALTERDAAGEDHHHEGRATAQRACALAAAQQPGQRDDRDRRRPQLGHLAAVAPKAARLSAAPVRAHTIADCP